MFIHALLRIPFSIQQYVLLKMSYLEQYPIYEVGQTYTGQRKSYFGWNTQNSRQMWLSVPYSECLTPYRSMFCSRCSAWNSIYIKMPYFLQQYALLGMLEMRLFGVGHLKQDMRLRRAIQSKRQLSGVPHSKYCHYPEPGSVKILTPVGTKGWTETKTNYSLVRSLRHNLLAALPPL